ncbi:MAG: hypothetical protein ACOX47_14435 [Bacillota bacterium]|jgi:predicted nucleic-acid-binding Zn-ribbon protein
MIIEENLGNRKDPGLETYIKNIWKLLKYGGSDMYYSPEQLERMKKGGEEHLKKQEEEKKGYKYKSGNGIQVICIHCKHDHFHKGSALLNTRGMTFFDLDWLNQSATTLICASCGYIHWFGKEVKQI